MVRRDGKDEPLPGVDEPCCTSPAGASPSPVSVGAPGSRSPASGETPKAEARRREPREGRQGRGPQHEVKLAASTDSQSGSRAAHVTAKATTATGRSETTSAGSRGVRSAARVQGEARNTGDPSARPLSGQRNSTRPTAKATAVQRKSEGIVIAACRRLHRVPQRRNNLLRLSQGLGRSDCSTFAESIDQNKRSDRASSRNSIARRASERILVDPVNRFAHQRLRREHDASIAEAQPR